MNEWGGITTADGAPCGHYEGEQSAVKFSGFMGKGTVSLDQNTVANGLFGAWPALGFENFESLCCTGSACKVQQSQTMNNNECGTGSNVLKCAGDGTHGICSIWNEGDSGQFFLVNTDAPNDPPPPPPSSAPPESETTFTPPESSSPSSGSVTASRSDHPITRSASHPSTGSGPTAPASLTAQAPPSATDPSSTRAPAAGTTSVTPASSVGAASIPTWAIALIAGLSGLLALCAIAFLWSKGCCGSRQRHRHIDPFLPAPGTPAASIFATSSRTVTEIAPPLYSRDDPLELKTAAGLRRESHRGWI
ncbi:hypothetical protein EXIGLDRAFT_724623 [Exidia glandulosa HHB12029]|uniref:Uncharacterized protein n=1 Tax=Exidia glandulosa HHB12029 TaxID=1314781 RepID=A0A165MQR4_EXIGL|nr:hypothetical protein EXIGLDRAFT_724623 [Exidia glandulosa HHB12029]